MTPASLPDSRHTTEMPRPLGLQVLTRWWEPIGLLLLAAFAVWVNRRPQFDLRVSQWFFDTTQGLFPYARHWMWWGVLHEGATWSAALLLGWLGVRWLRTFGRNRHEPNLKSTRAFLLFTLTGATGSVLLALGLRSVSPHSCPTDLQFFGSTADVFSLFEPSPGNPGPGRCLPSGDAAIGFMWIAAIYAARRWRPEIAARITVVVFVAGLAIGAGEIVRGAHLLSHVLLTAALCWMLPWTYAHWWPDKKPHT